MRRRGRERSSEGEVPTERAALQQSMGLRMPFSLSRDLLLGLLAGIAATITLARLSKKLAALQSPPASPPPSSADSAAAPSAARPDPSFKPAQSKARETMRQSITRRATHAAIGAARRLSGDIPMLPTEVIEGWVSRGPAAAAHQPSEDKMAFVERRFFEPPRQTVELCRNPEEGVSVRPWQAQRQRWLLSIADGQTSKPKVHNRLWVTYRTWVDKYVAGREGRPDIFHNFCIARALGVKVPCHAGGTGMRWWTGTEAGDLLSCLAASGVLVRGSDSGKAALEEFLSATLDAYNNRFQLAHNRTVQGFTMEEEGPWSGGYDFVQLADPQVCACVQAAVLCSPAPQPFNKCSHAYLHLLSLSYYRWVCSRWTLIGRRR